MKVKIGQEVKFKEDFEIITLNGRTINVKEGDKGIVISCGNIKHLNGDARGMIQKIDNIEIEGYDYENISKMILNRLNKVFGLKEFLSYEEIDSKEFIEEIEDLLSDIL